MSFSNDGDFKSVALAAYRYYRTLHHEGIDYVSEPAEASLTTAELCLEQVGDVSTSEEGADLATVASAHALVVMARSMERIERHLAVIAEHLTMPARTITDPGPGPVHYG